MKIIKIFIRKFSGFGGEIFYIFEYVFVIANDAKFLHTDNTDYGYAG